MISDPILLAYLDESLPSQKMAELESAFRSDESLRKRLAELISRRESGVHSVGDIWRRHRLSCATRKELGSFLLGAIADETADYLQFHIEIVGCRYCQANLVDLRELQGQPTSTERRKRIFQSSVGRVRNYPE